jgi:3-hydroxyisobutyrate dehydrogenase
MGQTGTAGAAGERVAVIGLGSMGSGMALSLLRAGFAVSGFDVNPAAVARFAEAGGSGAGSPATAAEGAAVVVSVVLNAAQTEAVLFGEGGCAAAMAPGSVFVSSATMAPSAARDLAARLEARGVHYLDAPISGGAQRAAEGALTVLVSGSPAAQAAADEALAALAAKVFRLGDAVGTAAGLKIVNQLLAGVHIAAAAEAMAFAEAHDLDLRTVYEVITASAGNSWMFENRVPHILDEDYAPRSATDIFVKDLGIVLDIARADRIPVPLASTALQSFLMTSAAGMGRDDDASVYRLYRSIMDAAGSKQAKTEGNA